MGSNWIDLKCSSLYVVTSLLPIKTKYNNSSLGASLVKWYGQVIGKY